MPAVFWTDTAKADVRQFLVDPGERLRVVHDVTETLALFPERFRRCPPETRFGPAARFFTRGAHTVVYDVVSLDDDRQEVWVRHLWPATGRKAGQLTDPGEA